MGQACSSLPTLGEWMFYSPSRCDTDPEQAFRIDDDDTRAGPRIGAHTGTLVKNYLPRLVWADLGHGFDGLWPPNDGALCLQVGEVGNAAMRFPNGCVTLESMCRCQAHLAHRAPRWLAPERVQRPSNFGGGPDLLGRLLSRGFRSLVWRRCVMRRLLQTRTVFWF